MEDRLRVIAREALRRDPAVREECDRLLARRIRDVRLTGPLLAMHRVYSWRVRGGIVRAWMAWVAGLSVAGLLTHLFVLRTVSVPMVLVAGVEVPLACGLGFLLWKRPRSAAFEGASIVVWIMMIILSLYAFGWLAGADSVERYLTSGIFVATVAIIVLGIELLWTLLVTLSAITLFTVLQLWNPQITPQMAVASSSYYALGIYATFVARRTISILAARSFLMSLRDVWRGDELAEANRQLEVIARIDSLTGVANRRSAAAHIERLWADERTPKSAIALIMGDIDHFKRLNDTHGHAAGDACLRQVADVIHGSIRAGTDLAARYGGEEFLVVLGGATEQEALEIAERIRAAVAGLRIPNGEDFVTMSLGLAFAEEGAGAELVTKWADEGLYEAKRGGRNRVRQHVKPALAS